MTRSPSRARNSAVVLTCGASNAVGPAGRPEEIAYPIFFLASDAATVLPGEAIAVFGVARASASTWCSG